MNVLFLTSELSGYVKTGGLADVSAALPAALRKLGHDTRILLPYFGRGQAGAFPDLEIVTRLEGDADIPPCDLASSAIDGTPVYFLVNPALYERGGAPYAGTDRVEWADNDVRFARLSLAAAQIAAGAGGPGWPVDLVHANDWPTALAPAYLAWRAIAVPSIFTVHNLAHQGLFGVDRLGALAIPPSAFTIDGVEFYRKLSFLKAGLVYATQVTTVSPTYAREIATEALGAGLHGLLAGLSADGRLTGIANGIGDEWSPADDPHLVQTYPPATREAKTRNADAVRKYFGLKRGRRPLFAMVSRLAHQKGVDLAIHAAETIVAGGGQFVLLGEGDRELERRALQMAAGNPENVGVRIDFDEKWSHRMIAGSDFYLMPSRFEPCGLNQMYAQRYGSLPVAHATGGLADTIEDGRTGVLFGNANGQALDAAIVRALQIYIDPKRSSAMRRAGMAKDFSWEASARKYEVLYRRAASGEAR